MRVQQLAARTGYYTTAAALAIVFLFPLVWAGWASVRPTPGSGQQVGYGFGNFIKLAHYGKGLPTYLLNSTMIAAMTVAGTLVVATLGGYAFARFRFPGRNLLFLAILAILMVPYPTLLIPLYVLLGWLGLQNTLVGLALVLMMFQLPFATFVMRNSFEAVPRELDEAAMVDGASSFAVLTRILLPAVRPGLITVGLFAFLASWSDFVVPLILISSPDRFPLPVAVVNMQQQVFGSIDYAALEAGVVVLAAPCMVLFLILQRGYVRGFMSGSLKG
ncbi:MAG TPA: carbohydrate ABC transporter permease [Kofleriaceae bacterium]|jgi:multiple sugar transport system permease protein|nr:carbohydrate ABC transporter permease [Kofleriaceae bacterium]